MDYFDKSAVISMSTDDLYSLLTVDRDKYRSEAIAAATDELQRRGMTISGNELSEVARQVAKSRTAMEETYAAATLTKPQKLFFTIFNVIAFFCFIFWDRKWITKRKQLLICIVVGQILQVVVVFLLGIVK